MLILYSELLKVKPVFSLVCAQCGSNDVEMLSEKFILSESERNNIFSSLVRSNDHTRYGLLNAVTDASKLAKYLYSATSEVKLKDILDSKFFGNLTVQIENENIDTEIFKIPLERQDDELFYYDEVANG